jgi:hypothetical protein
LPIAHCPVDIVGVVFDFCSRGVEPQGGVETMHLHGHFFWESPRGKCAEEKMYYVLDHKPIHDDL